MLSNRILHKTMQDIRAITGLDCAVWNAKGVCQVMTNEKMKNYDSRCLQFLESGKAQMTDGDLGFFVVEEDGNTDYVLGLKGLHAELEMAGALGRSQLENLIAVSRERMDRNRFFQNLILNNMLLVDVYNQAKKMGISIEGRRIVFIVETKTSGETIVRDLLKGVYAKGTGDYVTAVDEKRVILIKSLKTGETCRNIEQYAKEIVDTMNAEAMVSVRVAYGNTVDELQKISQSYQEAGMALEVGRVFYPDKSILAYNGLGIGRLIHQIPYSLCEMFLQEVFTEGMEVPLDEEELATVYALFDSNLNISETARKLYLHRNTLVYRLEKIHKKTGLDIRLFEDALTFKIAMMVAEHMKYEKELNKV